MIRHKAKEQALAWAFRLWSSGQSLSEKETRAAGFHVPTRGGWRRAETAMFGYGWVPCSNGKRLDGFLKSAGVYSRELEAQRDYLLLPASEFPRRSATEDSWVRFLSAAGVRDHLRPIGGQKIVKYVLHKHWLTNWPRQFQNCPEWQFVHGENLSPQKRDLPGIRRSITVATSFLGGCQGFAIRTVFQRI